MYLFIRLIGLEALDDTGANENEKILYCAYMRTRPHISAVYRLRTRVELMFIFQVYRIELPRSVKCKVKPKTVK